MNVRRTLCFTLTFAGGLFLVSAPAVWASADAHGGHGSRFTLWNWPESMGDPVGVGYMLINFLVLLVALNKIVFKPLRTKHVARSEQIQKDLERATKAREEAEALLKKSEKRFAEIEKEASDILEGARTRGEQTRKRLLDKAEQDAKMIREHAKQFAERNAIRVRAEIEAEVASRAVQRAEAIIRQQIGPEDQSRLVDTYIHEVSQLALGGSHAAKGVQA